MRDADPRCATICAIEEPSVAGAGDICSTASVVLNNDYCDSQTCTMTGRTGTCTYPYGNQQAREACLRQVDPGREVACEAGFRSVTECATVCQPSSSSM
jgi:hypothetical protein